MKAPNKNGLEESKAELLLMLGVPSLPTNVLAKLVPLSKRISSVVSEHSKISLISEPALESLLKELGGSKQPGNPNKLVENEEALVTRLSVIDIANKYKRIISTKPGLRLQNPNTQRMDDEAKIEFEAISLLTPIILQKYPSITELIVPLRCLGYMEGKNLGQINAVNIVYAPLNADGWGHEVPYFKGFIKPQIKAITVISSKRAYSGGASEAGEKIVAACIGKRHDCIVTYPDPDNDCIQQKIIKGGKVITGPKTASMSL